MKNTNKSKALRSSFIQSDLNSTAPFSEAEPVPNKNLSKSDVKDLRIRTTRASQSKNKKIDKRGRYMRDILKQSECFENLFSNLSETQ